MSEEVQSLIMSCEIESTFVQVVNRVAIISTPTTRRDKRRVIHNKVYGPAWSSPAQSQAQGLDGARAEDTQFSTRLGAGRGTMGRTQAGS